MSGVISESLKPFSSVFGREALVHWFEERIWYPRPAHKLHRALHWSSSNCKSFDEVDDLAKGKKRVFGLKSMTTATGYR